MTDAKIDGRAVEANTGVPRLSERTVVGVRVVVAISAGLHIERRRRRISEQARKREEPSDLQIATHHETMTLVVVGRPLSSWTLALSCGELKNALPASSSAFDSV